MFQPVVVACDQSSLDVALAVRGALELFRLHVYLHFCVQKRNAVDLLAGRIPETSYLVLCSHGLGSTDASEESADEMKMGFHVVDEIDGRWEAVEFALTPRNIPEYVRLPGRAVLALGCGNGRGPLARAFLETGCRAYMGAVQPVDQDAAAMFAIAFFYHLRSSERDPRSACSEQEAFARAAAFDPTSREGTHLFRYYTRE